MSVPEIRVFCLRRHNDSSWWFELLTTGPGFSFSLDWTSLHLTLEHFFSSPTFSCFLPLPIQLFQPASPLLFSPLSAQHFLHRRNVLRCQHSSGVLEANLEMKVHKTLSHYDLHWYICECHLEKVHVCVDQGKYRKTISGFNDDGERIYCTYDMLKYHFPYHVTSSHTHRAPASFINTLYTPPPLWIQTTLHIPPTHTRDHQGDKTVNDMRKVSQDTPSDGS